jgi:hypothetical protein
MILQAHNPQYRLQQWGWYFDAFNPNLPFMRHSIKSPCSDFTVYQLPVDLYTSPVMLQDKILFEV